MKKKADGTHKDRPPKSSLEDIATAKVPLVIGIGASAGGIEALESFFSNVPRAIGMAFVVIQHLAPQHKSILSELIQRHTQMPVKQAQSDMQIESNAVYVIPPNAMLAIFNGKLQLMESPESAIRLPIDYFFRSLADEMHEQSVGIILSGTGSDGTLGLQAIKGEGGIIIVQEPSSAGYDGMPQSAIATGLADFILSPAAMPKQLADYFKRFKFAPKTLYKKLTQEKTPIELVQQILLMIRLQTGHDFSHYKQSTVVRRIERLMAVNQIEKMSDYVRFLQNNTVGVEVLFRDLLIGVTSFFRDRDVFESLKESILPNLFQNRHPHQPIRIWVPACSTGEEAYSIAILVREQMALMKKEFRVQIFATDLDTYAISHARMGYYLRNIVQDVPENYLNQYFLQTPDGFEVTKSLRELILFAPQSVTKDPPFSKIDLISCRNLLIYLDIELQERVLASFHFALLPSGFLLLGSSESLGQHDQKFKTIDIQAKIFQRLPGASISRFRMDTPSLLLDVVDKDVQTMGHSQPSAVDLKEIVEKLLLDKWTPTCVIINDQGHLRYVHGQSGKYLEIASGKIDQLDIVRSVREGLKLPLTTAIYRAITQKQEIRERNIRVKANSKKFLINLTVTPLQEAIDNDSLLAVLFEDQEIIDVNSSENIENNLNIVPSDEHEESIRLLQHELNATQEYLQATIEELTSSNEEMQSTNEELQSVNEELETSQEELQAVNEELLTINTELEEKIHQLNLANNDLDNTFNTIQTGVILLDNEFRIRRFNPAANQVFRLIAGDTGRSINDIVSEWDYPSLPDNIEQVFNSLVPFEQDILTSRNRWFALQIRPYRTTQNAINQWC